MVDLVIETVRTILDIYKTTFYMQPDWFNITENELEKKNDIHNKMYNEIECYRMKN